MIQSVARMRRSAWIAKQIRFLLIRALPSNGKLLHGKRGNRTVWRLHPIAHRRSIVPFRFRVSTTVVVTEPGSPKEPEVLLRCSRGSAMKRFYERPAVNKIKLTRDGSAREGRHGSRQ
jgi:hypothetical protein